MNRLISSSNTSAGTRHRVLAELMRQPGDWISGGELSRLLSVSRNAVWRAVRQLAEAGYVIESVTGRGYRLMPSGDTLTASSIRAALDQPHRFHLEVHPTLDSTNSRLKALARDGAPDGTVVTAEHQQAGRGRMGRSFFSPPGTGLYFSLLMRPDACGAAPPNGTACSPGGRLSDALPVSVLPAAAAVVTAAVLEEQLGLSCGIKWVNDLYLDGRKVCGILTEAEMDLETGAPAYIVLGVGLNLYPPAGGFPPELDGLAAALLPDTAPRPGLRSTLIAAWLNRWTALNQIGSLGAVRDAYRKRSILTGQTVQITAAGERLTAEAVGIDDDFRLLLRLPDGERRAIHCGEATLHRP
uniref:HTH domain-containing protein n=1 Tax=Porphyromonas macacae TaxID=28115 RepID=UPI0024ADA380